MIDPGLQDKVVLVTGANHGIGAATAQALALQGARIFINYLRLPPLGTPSEQAQEDDMQLERGALAWEATRKCAR